MLSEDIGTVVMLSGTLIVFFLPEAVVGSRCQTDANEVQNE